MRGDNVKKLDFISAFLIFSLCAVGLFHEFVACIAGLVLVVYLGIYICRNKSLKIYFNLCFISVLLIVLSYGISVFWALDHGVAVIGFFKFLPLLIFLIVIMQQQEKTEDYFKILPYVASAMTIISTILMQIPTLTKWFSVSGRLSGFFQYSNTFAVFLLIALIITATKEKYTKTDFFFIPIILFGIMYSGSRTVFALMLVSVFVIIILNKNKKFKIILLTATVTIISVALIYALLTDNFRTIGRFLTVSLQESTFVGRLLYFRDAFPVILRHPFGMGYMGYYYYQHSIQTGVYTVKFIHNDFLQLLLDIGWIPVIIFVVAILKPFFKKGTSLQKRLLLFVISAHSCFDFDFQYLAIFMIFILLLDYKDGKEKQININTILSISVTSVISILFAYIGLAQALTYFMQYDLSDKIYPWNTQNHIEMLANSQDLTENEEIADKVIENNGHVAIAYDVKSKLAYSKGDFAGVIEYKEKAIEVSPFTYKTYEDYCYMLINGIYLYEKVDDEYSADVCKKELIKTVAILKLNTQRLSQLGRLIDDQPTTKLPDDIIKYVEALNYEK